MKNQKLSLFIIMLLFASCTTRMQMTSTSMEGTIKKGETFLVVPNASIKRNDIIAFEHTDKYFGDQIWVFRAVGIPGDKIEIKGGQLFVNDARVSEPEKIKFSYHVRSNGKINPVALDGLEFKEINNNEFVFFLTQDEKEILEQNPLITEINGRIKKPGEFDRDLAENDTIKNWNTDNYGPIQIPGKGDHEEMYFVLGDNRHNALDSRYIGLISKTKIKGVIGK